ncbi:hypothetical protein SAMN04487968_11238 [Nocardioides terrae]|uniref:Uncharacterized protein n=1 Tax=Nocardioides terrae TaxID=574651 RepID=A0A1I1MCS3_9ACTN|nr:hypothetical protein [Nocardioides terrae]SFC83201.1 hypothetical protein SAMN04487968_11238 [Nocardioides terrae]
MSETAKGWAALVALDVFLIVLWVWIFDDEAARSVIAVVAGVANVQMLIRLVEMRRDRRPK